MKRLLYLILAIALFGCTENNKPAVPQEQPAGQADTTAVTATPASSPHKHVRGIIGDGTSMNVIEVVSSSGGDTAYITTPAQEVAGGVSAGDEIDIIYNDDEEDCIALVAVNLSALTKVWNRQNEFGIKQSMELCPDGIVNTWNMGAANYDRWTLQDGKLLLQTPAVAANEIKAHTDTFLIMSLNTEQLILSNNGSDIVYHRK